MMGFWPAIGRTLDAVTETARLAMTIWPKTMMAPMLRSMPAVRMMRVCAMAKVPTTTVCWVRKDRLPGSRNLELMSAKMTIATTSTTSGLM
ncbi:unannotated protein [freshwater metagenome]|uniref:Unannotated protein n=1 Tax=freshwater metagenome TaxID=449393 RepID=A0A6J7KV78_9ZZZZ